jgi:hypothetical protein
MNPVIVTALVGAACAIIGSLATFWIQSRRLPSDIRLADAQAEKAQHEASSLVIASLSTEVGRLKQDMADIRVQLARAVDAEVRAAEFRRATVAIGEGRKKDRDQAQHMASMMMEIIKRLLDCLEDSTKEQLDRATVAGMVQYIIDHYLDEIGIGV